MSSHINARVFSSYPIRLKNNKFKKQKEVRKKIEQLKRKKFRNSIKFYNTSVRKFGLLKTYTFEEFRQIMLSNSLRKPDIRELDVLIELGLIIPFPSYYIDVLFDQKAKRAKEAI